LDDSSNNHDRATNKDCFSTTHHITPECGDNASTKTADVVEGNDASKITRAGIANCIEKAGLRDKSSKDTLAQSVSIVSSLQD
jgi:hypothetical protein